ncbi:MAG TPA: family 43 glycosylhydrolase [Cytophagales bacterium]
MLKRLFLFAAVLATLSTSCRMGTQNATEATDTVSTAAATAPDSAAAAAADAPAVAKPVLPGDFPDPSVAKVGNTYWATATSSEWAPLFPLLRSDDLVHWETVGHVFPKGMPKWADANFWAPEISYENGKVYIYYTAHKKGGNLCVGVASADRPEGPYTDHGPLVCQEVGSIDGFPVRDENGDLYLVWKEDGNSRDLPTPIWGQRMNEARTALTGEKFELFRNDPKTWEGRLVEGPALVKRGDYFYLFYAGDACCGRGCTYAEGVARSRSLKGPWEKYAGNPILKGQAGWKCPGHGTVITGPGDKDYFLYHAYSTDGFVYTGRQGILTPLTWNAEGWPVFPAQALAQRAPAEGKALDVAEEFSADSLARSWQWPVGQQPKFSVQPAGNGLITLAARPEKIGAVLGQRTKTETYAATAAINPASISGNEAAGLAAVGDLNNALGVWVKDGQIALWQTKGDTTRTVLQQKLPKGQTVQLRMTAAGGHQYRFAWSPDGTTWNELNADKPLDGSYLPPWDRGIRVGLLAKGPAGADVQFDWFRLSHGQGE